MGGLDPEPFDQSFHTNLFLHPVFQKRFGSFPQIKIGIQLSAEPLDIEHRFLQQKKLRLYLDIETARSLEQPHENQPERKIPERPVEHRFATGSDRRFQFHDTGIGRRPSRLDIGLRHHLVITPEKSDEVSGKIFLVEIVQHADDSQIQCDIPPESLRFHGNQDIARDAYRHGKTHP